MGEILSVIQSNLFEILGTLLVAVASFIGTKIKNIYETKANDETKRKVVKTVVNAVEQLYQDLKGEEKLEKAQESIVEILNEKDISISELEMKMLIEETCNSFNQSVKE
jgi:intergrase/recombinase